MSVYGRVAAHGVASTSSTDAADDDWDTDPDYVVCLGITSTSPLSLVSPHLVYHSLSILITTPLLQALILIPQNDVSEKEQRKGSKIIQVDKDSVPVSMDAFREQVIQQDNSVRSKEYDAKYL